MEGFRFVNDDFSPAVIGESGQCFRMVTVEEGVTELVALGECLRLREEEDGSVLFSCSEEDFNNKWKHYFDLDNDYEKYRAVALPDDSYLREAVSFGRGIRILNQESWEMLISFIISQRKSVPAIRTAVERLSRSFGRPFETEFGMRYAFPEPERLAAANPEELAACSLGYRVPYILETARDVCEGRLELTALESLSTEELIECLLKEKGVGIKVASCVALFGYHRLDVVPVDVWMKRVIENVYGGELPREYKPYAGVIQQYLFNYARLKGLNQGQ